MANKAQLAVVSDAHLGTKLGAERALSDLRALNASASSSDESLFVALNAVDFSDTGSAFSFYSEAVTNVTVGGGPAGGPASGSTLATVLGTGLEEIAYCKFGNGTASPVHGVCTRTSCTCVSTPIGDGTAPDGAAFADGPVDELSAGVGDGVNPAIVHPRGFVPLPSFDKPPAKRGALVNLYHRKPLGLLPPIPAARLDERECREAGADEEDVEEEEGRPALSV